MRGRGWGAYDADNTRWAVRKLPISDFGEAIDPPTADVTAHAVAMLAEAGYRDHAATRRGMAWLLRAQEPDGSWWGRWGTNFIYGTSSVLPALVAAGVPAGHPSVRRGSRWLVGRQNADGGWGEDQRSYADPAQWSGRRLPHPRGMHGAGVPADLAPAGGVVRPPGPL